MIKRPASNDRVEQHDESRRRYLRIGFDDIPDFIQKCLDALLGWFDQELAIIFTYILSQEIEPLTHVHHPGLVLRQAQTQPGEHMRDLFAQRFGPRASR